MTKLYVYFSAKNEYVDGSPPDNGDLRYALYICKESYKAGKIMRRSESFSQTILDVTGDSNFERSWIAELNKVRIDFLTKQLVPIIKNLRANGYSAVISKRHMGGYFFTVSRNTDSKIMDLSNATTLIAPANLNSAEIESLITKPSISFDAAIIHPKESRLMTLQEIAEKETAYQKELQDAVAAMKPLNPNYSTTVKITGMLDYKGERTKTVYEVSPEEATAAIAVIEEHRINTKPVKLTDHTSSGSYAYNLPQVDTTARGIPHHTTEGDELEISDIKTHETYQLKVSRNFRNLCYFNRPNSWQDDKANAQTIRDALKTSLDEKSGYLPGCNIQ